MTRRLFQAQAKVFGSLATGLSLPESDVDICITGMAVYRQQDILEILNKMTQHLNLFQWAIHTKPILTASVPVLKLSVNPRVKYTHVHGTPEIDLDGLLTDLPDGLDPDEKQEWEQSELMIQVDITVETQLVLNLIDTPCQKNLQKHMGLLSTEMMKQWLSLYPGLQVVAIVLKRFLHRHGLNDTYSGGLSSYCLLILIIATLKPIKDYDPPAKTTGPAAMLLSFLDYYGLRFDSQRQGISVFLEPSSVYTLPSESPGLMVVDPLNFNSNLTQCCYKSQAIFSLFASANATLLSLRSAIDHALIPLDLARLAKMGPTDLRNHQALSPFFKNNLLPLLVILSLLPLLLADENYWMDGEPDNYHLNFGLEQNWRNPMRIRKLHEEEIYDKWHDTFMKSQEAKSKANFADIYQQGIDNFKKMGQLSDFVKGLSSAQNDFKASFNPAFPNRNRLNNLSQQRFLQQPSVSVSPTASTPPKIKKLLKDGPITDPQDNNDLLNAISFVQDKNEQLSHEPPNNQVDSTYSLSEQAFQTELGEGNLKAMHSDSS